MEVFTPLVLRRERAHANWRWDDKNRDCAGLVRYIFWEALQRHDERFYDAYVELRALAPPQDFATFSTILRAWTQRNTTAPQLVAHSHALGRDARFIELQTGDLLYFYSNELKIRHVMLVVRSGPTPYLVYHTGDSRNELRIRTFADIMDLPEGLWYPDAANPVFRGFYRPAFL